MMNRGRGSGLGRGAIMRLLLDSENTSQFSGDSESTSADIEEQSEVQQASTPSPQQESTPSPQQECPSSQTSSGRGRLLQQHVSTKGVPSAATTSGVGMSLSAGRGRGSLLTADSSNLCVSNLTKTSSLTTRGRGKLFETVVSDTNKFEDPEPRPCSSKEVAKVTKMVQKITIEEEKILQPVLKHGTKGTPRPVSCNYIRLKADPSKGIFEYEVQFRPRLDSKQLRIKLLNEHRDKFGGTKTFDGIILYLPIQLPDKVTKYISKNPSDGSNIEIEIIYKRKRPLKSCVQLYNILFDRIMKILNFVRFDRKQFDPTNPKIIPQYNLEIWPGFVTAVDEYENGLMLCCDISHKLLFRTTVLDQLRQIHYASQSNFQENAKRALLGSVILTRYNNKTYRIDDIMFDSTPKHTFKMGNQEISYLKYYQQHYNITINDENQPLLLSIKNRRVAGQMEGDTEKTEQLMFCLVPEICHMTGLRDELRNDFKVMREIAAFTRVTPNQRVATLRKFYDSINNCAEARAVLSDWGLQIANANENLVARHLGEEVVHFRNKQIPVGANADFNRALTNNEMLEVVNITNWLLLHTRRDTSFAKAFLDCVERCARPMGIEVLRPRVHVIERDTNEEYTRVLRELISPQTQIVVIICPTARDDRYAAIKKLCCAEIPVPSQVINSKTLSNDAKRRSIVQKIILQMNCKLGGTLWTIRIPFKNVMICGVDTYHSPGSQSVAALVCSMNNEYTKWYSRAIIQKQKEELVNGLCATMKYALTAYRKLNHCLPDRIIFFRDGVGDGQLPLCSEYEIPQLKDACSFENPDYNPSLTFIVVQKRINTRIFYEKSPNNYENPEPGCVLDHTITRRYMYDYFLVSQSVRQGTVSPTHFIVIWDDSNFEPDIVQRLSYKMCFLYYNWPGTVRAPACCQYAHKLAYLVGQNIRKPVAEKLNDKLFYL